VKLADPLKHLSVETTNLVAKFMEKGGPLDHFITNLGNGIEWLAARLPKSGIWDDRQDRDIGRKSWKARRKFREIR
jgi:hypothetical protein